MSVPVQMCEMGQQKLIRVRLTDGTATYYATSSAHIRIKIGKVSI